MSKREALFTAMRGRIFSATFTKTDGSIRQAWGQLIKTTGWRSSRHCHIYRLRSRQPRRAKLDKAEFRSGKTVFKGVALRRLPSGSVCCR